MALASTSRVSVVMMPGASSSGILSWVISATQSLTSVRPLSGSLEKETSSSGARQSCSQVSRKG